MSLLCTQFFVWYSCDTKTTTVYHGDICEQSDEQILPNNDQPVNRRAVTFNLSENSNHKENSAEFSNQELRAHVEAPTELRS